VPVKETALTSAIFDQLRLAMAADPVGLANLYRDYLADAWQSWQAMEESLPKRDFATAKARAHSVKGSSLLLGAHVLARHAARFEDDAIATNSSQAGVALEDMLGALRDVQQELVDRLGPGVLPAGETAA
jgi:HPt (histidine-containing phosphotransfer) domain-containing protein